MQGHHRQDHNMQTDISSSTKHAQRAGVHITFSNLSFTVRDVATGQDKQILAGVSGAALPGRLFAMMGASGAGKTTLLDILAANTYGGSLQGEVLVNSRPRDTRTFLKTSCYVMQKDLLYASATVRECITTSALLRLPMTMSNQAKKDRVEEVIRELEMEGCADTLIGDETLGIKGVSGGQKRRVSLAIELVKDPAVIFADEPTSGLDSEVALSIMEALHMLSRKHRTVVCTIHQPNSDITDLFDDFMLLAKGRCVYTGAWRNAVGWFAQQGFQAPVYKNPTDYFMSIVKCDDVVTRLADTFASDALKATVSAPAQLPAEEMEASPAAGAGTRVGALDQTMCPFTAIAIDAAHTSFMRPLLSSAAPAVLPSQHAGGTASTMPAGRSTSGTFGRELGARDEDADTVAAACILDDRLAGVSVDGGVVGAAATGRRLHWYCCGTQGEAAERAPWWYQVVILYRRNIRNWLRNPIMLASEFVQYAFISVFVGLMYFKFTDDADGVYNRSACIWFAFAIMCFTPSYTAVTSWHSERLLVSRELKQRQYGVTPLYLARTAVLLPAQLMQCLVFVAVMYFFVGFQPSGQKFFIFFAVLSMFQLVSEGIGLLAAIISRHPTYAVILLTFILLLVLSFSGILMTKIPVYFIWINKSSYLTYAYISLLQSELEGLWVPSPTDPSIRVEAMTLLPSVSQNGLTMAQNIGILASQFAFMEVLKLAVLYGTHWTGLM